MWLTMPTSSYLPGPSSRLEGPASAQHTSTVITPFTAHIHGEAGLHRQALFLGRNEKRRDMQLLHDAET